MADGASDATVLLKQASGGDEKAAQDLVLVVYSELRRQAEGLLRRERPDHTLQPTALVHEAYLRLVDQSRVDWKGKTHFKAVAAVEMRRVLLDYAKAHNAAKRGRGWLRVDLDEEVMAQVNAETEVADVLTVLEELADLSRRQAQVVELRFFGGLTLRETAQALGVARQTVERDWRIARAWLLHRLEGEISS